VGSGRRHDFATYVVQVHAEQHHWQRGEPHYNDSRESSLRGRSREHSDLHARTRWGPVSTSAVYDRSAAAAEHQFGFRVRVHIHTSGYLNAELCPGERYIAGERLEFFPDLGCELERPAAPDDIRPAAATGDGSTRSATVSDRRHPLHGYALACVWDRGDYGLQRLRRFQHR